MPRRQSHASNHTFNSSMYSLLRDIVGTDTPSSSSFSLPVTMDELDSEDPSKLVNVFVTDIEPDTSAAEAVATALKEMTFVKETFDDWAEQISQASKGRRNGHLHSITIAIDDLRNRSLAALNSSSELLRTHEAFSRQMEMLLEETSRRDRGMMKKENVAQLLLTGGRIQKFSQALDKEAAELRENIQEVLQLAERIQRHERDKKTRMKYLGYVRKTFCVLAVALAIGALVAGVMFAFPVAVPAATTTVVLASFATGASLATVTAKFCKILKDKPPEEAYVNMLDFLQNRLPEEAGQATRGLERFSECQRVIQIDAFIKQGKIVRMSRSDALLAQDQWRRHREAIAVASQGCVAHV